MIEKIKATNPYSGESEMLTPEEHKLYIEIKEAELDEDYTTMQKGLSKFSRLNAKAYMTLLDKSYECMGATQVAPIHPGPGVTCVRVMVQYAA